MIPPYQRIAEALRADIESGLFPVETQIPTQYSLVRRFGASRATVQRALQELLRDGYIESQQGRGAFVRDRAQQLAPLAERLRYGPTGVILSDHLSLAFESPQVTLDVYSLTTETLAGAINVPFQRIRQGELQIDSLTVRVLLPDTDVPLALPRNVADAADPRPQDRLKNLIKNSTGSLGDSIRSLQELGYVSSCRMEVKCVAATPFKKLYLINGTDALFGLYPVVKSNVSHSGAGFEIYDVHGYKSTLFHFSNAGVNPDPRDVAYVAEYSAWFESLWQTIAGTVTLFE